MGNSLRKYLLLICILSFGLSAYSKDLILVASKDKGDFLKYRESLVHELKDSYKLKFVDVNKVSYKDFESLARSMKPRAMILMDNRSVALAKNLYKNTDIGIPSIAVMGLNLQKSLGLDKNICGISYEVPNFTLLTNYRNLLNRPLKKVLVFYRSSEFGETISRDIEILKQENIQLEAVDVEKYKDVEKYLTTQAQAKIISSKDVDAVLVLLDSVLINNSLFSKFWLPTAELSKKAFLVSTRSLLAPKLNFAVFGMSPNLADLASQTRQMLNSILIGKKTCTEMGVEELIGVDLFWNKRKGDSLGLIPDKGVELNLVEGAR